MSPQMGAFHTMGNPNSLGIWHGPGYIGLAENEIWKPLNRNHHFGSGASPFCTTGTGEDPSTTFADLHERRNT